MEAKERVCPKCGTILMEDNFCMGCGSYVDPDVVPKEEETAPLPEGILAEPTATGSVTDGYAAAGYSAEGYSTTGYSAEGYSAAGSAPAQTTHYEAPAGEPVPFLKTILIMAGIAVAVFLAVFVVDMATKLHTETVSFVAPASESYTQRTYYVTYTGDQVEDLKDVYEFDISGLDDDEKKTVVDGMKSELSDEYDIYVNTNKTMEYSVESDGSTLTVTIEYHYLDTEKGRRTFLSANGSGTGDVKGYIAFSTLKKTIVNKGWTQQ